MKVKELITDAEVMEGQLPETAFYRAYDDMMKKIDQMLKVKLCNMLNMPSDTSLDDLMPLLYMFSYEKFSWEKYWYTYYLNTTPLFSFSDIGMYMNPEGNHVTLQMEVRHGEPSPLDFLEVPTTTLQ